MLHGYVRTTKIQAVANALHLRPRMLIYINSWPSAGKKIIGALLAARLKARFVHNHHFLDFVEACCDRSDPNGSICTIAFVKRLMRALRTGLPVA